MPTIICTKDSFTLDTIEGFDQLGGKDDFSTATLEKRLSIKGAIDIDESELVSKSQVTNKKTFNVKSNRSGKAIYSTKKKKDSDSDSEHEDDNDDKDD